MSKMIPRPDHGETSYKGSGRLVGRKALVTGGDSGIGRAAAIAFAREGANVAINYLPVEESDAREVVKLIQAEGRKAVAIPGDIRNEDFLLQACRQRRPGAGRTGYPCQQCRYGCRAALYRRSYDGAVRFDL